MESLQERKEKAMRELREIETLENQHEILNRESEKNELIERLLTDLRDSPLGCALPLSSIAHVKSVFRQQACKAEMCGYFETCQQIISLTGKQSPVKRSKSNRQSVNRLSTVKMNIERNGGHVAISYDHWLHRVVAPNWATYKTNLKTSLPRKQALSEGLTAGQYSALMHEASMKKFF